MLESPSPNQPWRGSASLCFTAGSDGTTQLQGGAQAPLKLMRHFSECDGRCVVPLLHTAGGLVGGDQLHIDLRASTGSRALITSVAAQKIYGSRGRSRIEPQGRWAEIQLQAQLDAEASIEWLPQETVVFSGALLEQDLQVVMQPGASWLGAEVVRLGRTARGEDLGNGCWRSSLSIRRGERWAVVDRLGLAGDQLEHPHGMDGQPALGTLVWIAPQPLPAAELEQLLNDAQSDRGDLPGVMAVGALEPGLMARYRGPSTQAARLWFFRLWRRIRAIQHLPEPSWPRTWPFQEAELAFNPDSAAPTTTTAR